MLIMYERERIIMVMKSSLYISLEMVVFIDFIVFASLFVQTERWGYLFYERQALHH